MYLCPGGQELRRKTLHWKRRSIDYAARREVCASCPLRQECTRNKAGRTVTRHLRQEVLDRMRYEAGTSNARRDIARRQHVSEGSFGSAKRYGYKRARWRRLWRVEIQDYLTCTVQNLQKLLAHRGRGAAAAAVVARICRHFAALSALWATTGPCGPFSPPEDAPIGRPRDPAAVSP